MMTISVPRLGADILEQTHVAIAGTTGSGKSVLLQQILYALYARDPARNAAILIDPKRVELSRFSSFPHVWRCATSPAAISATIRDAVGMMDRRYQDMQRRGLYQTDAPAVYLIIDELADLVSTDRAVLGDLVRLGRLGRAAGIHIIAATQSPDRKTLSAQLVQNFPARVALRCRDRIESRQILGAAGAELLPKYGEALYYTPDTLQPVRVPVDMIGPKAWAALRGYYAPVKKTPFWRRVSLKRD